MRKTRIRDSLFSRQYRNQMMLAAFEELDMKIAIALLITVFAVSGCSALGPLQPDSQQTNFGTNNSESSAALAAPDPFPARTQNTGPQVIIPVTGGPPVLGIPVGGNLFVPVTGGPPVPGIPTSP
jgi:hypothetical protein